MKVRDYIAEAPAEREPSAVSRISPQWLALWWQITFGDRVELEDSSLREVQSVWESFGEVSINVDSSRWLERLQTTAATANRLLGNDAWEYLVHMGVRYQEALDYDTRTDWRREWQAIAELPVESIRKARSARLMNRIHDYFSRGLTAA